MGKHVGITGIGIYLPEEIMTAEDISKATSGVWSTEAVREKLGINQKYVPGLNDGTQEMGAKAAERAIKDADIDPTEIDVILCFGEEWKEYPLTTSALYIQDYIGATKAWGIDIQNRCCTTLTAIKMAKDMLMADDDIDTILIAGGYRNGDLVDYTEATSSMFFDLSAGGGALVLKKNAGKNVILGSHIVSDGSFARMAGVGIGGTAQPVNEANLSEAYSSLQLFEPEAMKKGLGQVSMANWMTCIDESLNKSGYTKADIDYLNILHIKRSAHHDMLERMELAPEQSIYLEDYGHLGQIDQILSLKLGLEQGKISEGSIVASIAAGIGYVWAANVIKWGAHNE